MTAIPNRDDLAAYLEMIFGYVEGDDTCIALRGIGEKGTDGDGDFRDIQIVPGTLGTFDIDRIFGHIQRWSQHGRASFIVPAAIDGAALSDKHATEDRIRLLTTILVDIDKGDTTAKAAHAEKYLGVPSMKVHSGGTTETGHPKLHLYWRLTEASDQVVAIAAARKTLALKLGGDPSFGRSTQVIRLPGSIYGKGGVAKPCRIAEKSPYEYELADILQAIADMPLAEGVVIDEAKLAPLLTAASYSSGGAGLNFSGFKAANGDLDNKEDLKRAFTTDIVEGGDEDRNRWNQFSAVAGKNIASVRQGILSLDEAHQHTATWMIEHMKPAWPAQRFETEWKSLLALDIKHKGPMPGMALTNPNGGQVIDAVQNGNGSYAPTHDIAEFAVANWMKGEKPKRKFLVEGMILAGKSHLLAAEGGAGKTFMLLDLALKIATHQPGQETTWCGLPLTDLACGTVVMFTTEDDADELHIRLSEMDPGNKRNAAGGKLTIIPTLNIGGAFALVQRQGGTGLPMRTSAWNEWLNQLRGIPDLKVVVIDTLNTTLHGEENNATIINEYVQAASAIVCGELGAALIVTHHVRKPGANVKIYTPEDMKNSVRGSTALIGAFRVALGIWHAPDFKERLERMGRDGHPGQLYNFAVVKANNPEMAFGTRAMLRQPSGLLLDITDNERQMVASTQGEVAAWLIHAVAYAAERGHPFTVKSAMKKPPNGRKHQLPPMLAAMSERKVQDLCEMLLDPADGRLVQCNPKGGKSYNHLDVPLGPLARAVGLDGGAYRVSEGADFTPPSWDHAFAYHPIDQRIVKKGDLEKTLIKLGSAGRPPESTTNSPDAPTLQSRGATSATGLRFSPNSHLHSDG